MSNSNTSNNSSKRSDDINKKVKFLIKKYSNQQDSNYEILSKLQKEYKDNEIIDAIMKKFTSEMKRIRKLSQKIQSRLFSKYPNLESKEYIEKIKGYQKKYGFDDSETQSIINQVFLNSNKFSNPEIFENNYNKMSKALGFMPASHNFSEKIYCGEDEREYLQVILTYANLYKELHNQVTLQSLIYSDKIEQTNIARVFDRQKINIFSFIHPVIAALFIPKFNLLDQHMLLASIAEIVHHKYNNRGLTTQPEYELYVQIATDPTETATVHKEPPFLDLMNRCNVQIKLWEAVLQLRQGKYYTTDMTSFIMAIDQCKNSVFDAADLAYVKDEGTILRKLLSVFSIRPIIVITSPIPQMTVPYVNHLTSVTQSHLTRLSMITIRIPQIETMEKFDLRSSLNQRQIYIHHKKLTLKNQEILLSRELLIFYVHRRYKTLNYNKLTHPFQFTNLPMTINQFEKLNKIRIEVPHTLEIGSLDNKQKFSIRSAVAIETQDITHRDVDCDVDNNLKIITSCSAIVVHNGPGLVTSLPIHAWIYNPLEISSEKDVHPIQGLTQQDFCKKLEENGTIFIYKCDEQLNRLG